MDRFPTRTTTELLDAMAGSAQHDVWALFDERYRPVVAGFSVAKLGLRPDEAEEAAQEMLVKFALGYRGGKYARGKGRLRSWLMAIAHRTAIDVLRARGRGAAGGAEHLEVFQPTRAHEEAWATEEDAAVAREAWELVQQHANLDSRTLRAYELTVLRGVPSEVAAQECGMSVDSLYMAKTRVAKKLHSVEAEVRAAFGLDE